MRSLYQPSIVVAAAALLATAGCAKQREGLPPAEEWGAVDLGLADPSMTNPHAGNPHARNPHAGNPHGEGMAFGGMGGNPHGAMGGDPHAGIDMSGMSGDPHAGIDMSGSMDITRVLPPPDPNRKLDPNRRITGVLKLDPKVAAKVKPSSTIFVFAKRASADGQPTGFPLASEKLQWTNAPQLAFALTDEDLMSGAAEFTGDVILMARVDQDEDASSREPGDVIGQTRVQIPADNVTLTLDGVLP